MKTLHFVLLLLLFAGCDKKDIKGYDPIVVETIQVKSMAMECFYQLINFHMVKAGNLSFNTYNCIESDSTQVGAMIYDTVTLFPEQLCPYFEEGNSSGGYTSIYPVSYPSLTDTVKIKLMNFSSNGYSISGTLNYIYTGSATVSCFTNNLTLSNDKGSTTVQAQFLFTNQTNQLEASGNLSGLGDFPFTWSSTTNLLAKNNHSTYSFYGNFLFHTGKGVFSIDTRSLTENYGNGEDDTRSIIEDNNSIRKVLELPRL